MKKLIPFFVLALLTWPVIPGESALPKAPNFEPRVPIYSVSLEAVKCLADAMYNEANVLGDKGMIGVGLVTLNRVKDHRYPNSVCKVVYQKVNGGYMYSWVGKKIYQDKIVYARAKQLAEQVLIGTYADFTHGSLWFYSKADDWFKQQQRQKRLIVTFTIHQKGFHKYFLKENK